MLGPEFPVRVVYPYTHADSLGMSGLQAVAETSDEPGMPFFIHLGEGGDRESWTELGRLDAMGRLRSNTVLVHGVALSPSIGSGSTRPALRWCCVRARTASSLGNSRIRRGSTGCSPGTDSTLTGSAHLLDELRTARGLGLSSPKLLEMVTWRAAGPLGLPKLAGKLQRGAPASLIALPGTGSADEALLAARPEDLEVVMVEGEIRVAAERICPVELPGRVRVGGTLRKIRGERSGADPPPGRPSSSGSSELDQARVT